MGERLGLGLGRGGGRDRVGDLGHLLGPGNATGCKPRAEQAPDDHAKDKARKTRASGA